MNRFNRKEKDKINQFKQITSASDKQAADCLKAAGWSVEGGIEVFYSSGMHAQVSSLDTRQLEALYKAYKDENEDLIMAEGVSQFCEDLGVDPSDIIMLVLSWHLNANIMCEYTKDEFVGGLSKMGVDSVEKLKRRLPELRQELRDPSKWHEIYNYAFSWAREKGQKCLQLETAVAMWQLLFTGDRRWEYIDEWCAFLQKYHNRAISKDTWVQLFEFVKNIKPDFTNFDPTSAWPYLIDEFVDHMREQKGLAAPSS